MKTTTIKCDACGKDITLHKYFTAIMSTRSGRCPEGSDGLEIYLATGSDPGSEKTTRDFCNELCLRDYLIQHLGLDSVNITAAELCCDCELVMKKMAVFRPKHPGESSLADTRWVWTCQNKSCRRFAQTNAARLPEPKPPEVQ